MFKKKKKNSFYNICKRQFMYLFLLKELLFNYLHVKTPRNDIVLLKKKNDLIIYRRVFLLVLFIKLVFYVLRKMIKKKKNCTLYNSHNIFI